MSNFPNKTTCLKLIYKINLKKIITLNLKKTKKQNIFFDNEVSEVSEAFTGQEHWFQTIDSYNLPDSPHFTGTFVNTFSESMAVS